MTKKPKETLEELAQRGIVPVGKWPEERWKAYEDELRCSEEPLVKALREVGVSVNSVWDLVNSREPYPNALPVLIRHLTGDYHPKVLAGIARALAVRDPFAIEYAWPIVLDLFVKTEADEAIKEPERRGFKEGLGVALSVLCTDEKLPQIFELIRDSSHGESRGHLIYGLKRFRKDKKVKEVLASLYDDPYWGELARKVGKERRKR